MVLPLGDQFKVVFDYSRAHDTARGSPFLSHLSGFSCAFLNIYLTWSLLFPSAINPAEFKIALARIPPVLYTLRYKLFLRLLVRKRKKARPQTQRWQALQLWLFPRMYRPRS